MLVPAGVTVEVASLVGRSWKQRKLEVELGGLGPGKKVLFFAADHGDGVAVCIKQLPRLAESLSSHLEKCLDALSASSSSTMFKVPPTICDVIVAQWLSRLVVWSPGAPSRSLEDELETALREATAHANKLAGGGEIGLILVDSLEPLYYAARAKYERVMGAWPALPSYHSSVNLTTSGPRSSSFTLSYPTPDPPLHGVLSALRELQRRTKACLVLSNGVDPCEIDALAIDMNSGRAQKAKGPQYFYPQPQSWPYPSPFRMNGRSPLPAPHQGHDERARDSIDVHWHITLLPRFHQSQDGNGLIRGLLRERSYGFVGSFGFELDRETGGLVPL
ncbi:hypothetical protein A4X09_0g5738 [Tilletia walkeri]|uniref:Uncharacterized protein n=1 Tax=Tilletia walkeri TaxID=117179 RepID=A0A8X7N585_9BASI|nr:hypothetical protein A4X09_0g5738 [Tilletia walkeri]